jgi:hypothetical protein
MRYEPCATLPDDVDEMTRAYLYCAEWCGVAEEQESALRASTHARWTNAALAEARNTCAMFLAAFATAIGDEQARAGHDLWLTRNHHGAGFWDGDWPDEAGRILTDGAHRLAERGVYFDAETETLEFE